ncbi:MAG: RHS repeat-associated core domain-containing protein, partial [Mameliella sp.]|nr:RHS repeat-associated core domain-containing protein [Phaeodactylibacter sp.]
ANGNILSLYRKSSTTSFMDGLQYDYLPNTNLLYEVTDNVSSGAFSGDFDTGSTSRYAYDGAGNIVDDTLAFSRTRWNAYGKVARVNHPNQKKRVTFGYGPNQNRVLKQVHDRNSSTTINTWYLRDAQGNVLAVYHQDSDTVTWSEQYLYGSSRLGSVEPDVTWHNGNDLNDTPYFSDQEKLCIGWKRYEISNHLGNVMAVLNDRKYYKDTDADDEAEYFDPVFMAATDYYPFGYEMPGRKYNFGDYRYGFNGKENDSDGEFSSLTHYDYGFRIYNPAIGRFLSVDPLTRSYPWYTPYQFAGNKPIWAVDLDGLEEFYSNEGEFLDKFKGSTEIRIINKDIYDYIKDSGGFFYRSVMLAKSDRAYKHTSQNELDVLKVWARQNRNTKREHAMSLFTGSIDAQDGSGKMSVFVAGNTVKGELWVPGENATVDPSGSTGPDGWSRHTTIHTHPRKSDKYDDFSNIRPGFMKSGGDMQWSIKTRLKLYMVPPSGDYMGLFDPKLYTEYVLDEMEKANKEFRNDLLELHGGLYKLDYPGVDDFQEGDKGASFWIDPDENDRKSRRTIEKVKIDP